MLATKWLICWKMSMMNFKVKKFQIKNFKKNVI